ncbi:hypothetical protein HYPSUDRAFT_71976 [Hypholoma sublateritium FD-334 SS-4]|uniref:Uncharacterized protein n=1 Tax=Hypholoma sublateritium (strain FD-334 SS-4) TaxID=945553 RepID=A0A0D2P4Y7_HYPSF|nr:hypothetical protein HYPSUDRAFT_71976 [Hypholoma sublateritium FD-334 SS-4]
MSAFHIALPTPPTRNALAPAERARLLRSTRKLGAVLGATPRLLEPAAAPARAFHSPASSVSSVSSLEPEYVLVKHPSRSAPYQPEPRPRPATRASGEKRRRGVPVALLFDAPGARGALTQPRLLRVAPASTAPAPTPMPLSPAASAFNVPLSPPPPPRKDLDDQQRRRKMAKLARTLGENVPPELVFRPAPAPTRNSKLARSASLFSPFNSHPSGPAPPVLAVAATPTPPVAAAPHVRTASATATLPPVRASSTTATPPVRAASSTTTTGIGGGMRTTGRRRAARPRSLALGAASAIAAADAVLSRRAAASMDTPRPAEYVPAPRPHPPPAQAPAVDNSLHPGDFGRRKEREWSGEWNVRDMDAVARRLRGLKGR